MARTLELDTITEPSNTGTANITLSSNTTTTMPLVDINGGAIDGTTIGAGTPSTIAASTLTASGATTLSGTLGVSGVTTLASANVTGALTAATLDTGQGANELYDMDQNVKTDSAVTFATVNTGQGANELYDMDQNVKTDSTVKFLESQTGSSTTLYTLKTLTVGNGPYGGGKKLYLDIDTGSSTSWINSVSCTINYNYNNTTAGALRFSAVWANNNDGEAEDFASFDESNANSHSWAITGTNVASYSGTKKGVRIIVTNNNAQWVTRVGVYFEFRTEASINAVTGTVDNS